MVGAAGRWQIQALRVFARLLGFICLTGLLWPGLGLFAADTNAVAIARLKTTNDFSNRAKRIYFEAQREYQTGTNADAAWKFGRACFDWADFATSKSDRAAIAQEGIDACRKLIARDSNSAPAHYYLAMDLGQLARTKLLGALKIVNEMEREFSAALKLDEHWDSAGPDRNLGLLYEEAPVFASIGSRPKARQHLERAVRLAPDFPENRLDLIEAYLKWGEHSNAESELKVLEKLWPDAQNKLAGDAWAWSWMDWDKRLKAVKKKIEETQKTIESPAAGNKN